jgi:hypothetical protein
MKIAKTLKNLRLGSLMLLFLLAMGCSLQDEEPLKIADESSDDVTAKIAHLRQFFQDGSVSLSGVQNYCTYAAKMKEVLQDGDLPCEVTIEFLEGHEIRVTIDEGRPDGPAICLGTMTPSGIVKFSFRDPGIIDIIQMHSGCEVYGGPGVNQNNLIYQGSFDGERMVATAPFYTKCEVFPYPTPTPIEGPVHWKWTIDVTAD